MPIPDYQTLMLPVLVRLRDSKPHSIADLTEKLAVEFNLTEDERAELLPSGGQFTFSNRVGWARTYMKKAGLLESPERGLAKITDRGLQVLQKKPLRIDVSYLEQFQEFQDFRRLRLNKGKKGPKDQNGDPQDKTPRELIEVGATELRDELSTDLLSRLKTGSPQFFERAVVDMLLKMGYGGSRKDAGQAIGRTGDGGIDGIIKEDRLGLDVIYVQAKRWESAVGRPVVQAFVGSLEGVRAQRGVIITTSKFTSEAAEYARQIGKKIVLIDGEMLAELMIDNNVGVTTEQTYTVKRVDTDYFLE